MLQDTAEDPMNQDERIEKLKAEVRRLNGGEDPPSSGIDTMPKDMAEKFLERIIAVEAGHATNMIEPMSTDGTQWHIAIPRRRSDS